MNIFFKISGKVVTPMLNGSILPGVTRASCIDLCKSWGMEVEERRVSVEELVEAAKTGALEECWGSGTAAVISPVGALRFEDRAGQPEVVRYRDRASNRKNTGRPGLDGRGSVKKPYGGRKFPCRFCVAHFRRLRVPHYLTKDKELRRNFQKSLFLFLKTGKFI